MTPLLPPLTDTLQHRADGAAPTDPTDSFPASTPHHVDSSASPAASVSVTAVVVDGAAVAADGDDPPRRRRHKPSSTTADDDVWDADNDSTPYGHTHHQFNSTDENHPECATGSVNEFELRIEQLEQQLAVVYKGVLFLFAWCVASSVAAITTCMFWGRRPK